MNTALAPKQAKLYTATVYSQCQGRSGQVGIRLQISKELGVHESLHPNKKMDESESLDDRRREDSLLIVLTDSIRGLEAVRHYRDHATGRKCTRGEPGRGGGGGGGGSEGGLTSPAECERKDGELEEKEHEKRVLAVMRELGVLHSDSLTAWREALREGARMLATSPTGGSDQQHPSTAETECRTTRRSDSFCDTFLSVLEDVQNITERLSTIISKVDEEILRLRAVEASTAAAALQEPGDPKASGQPEDGIMDLSIQRDVQVVCGQNRTTLPPDTEQTSQARFSSSDPNDAQQAGKGSVVKVQGSDGGDFVSLEKRDFLEETNENVNGKEETNKEWITVDLTGRLEESPSGAPYGCLIRAPPGVSEVLRFDVVDALSHLVVTGSEELVSRVIRVVAIDGAPFHPPVTLIVPFRAHYRGNYRDVAVKIVDEEGRSSYITPVTTEGLYGGQRGSFAEVRAYSLGLFAVVLCLKRESYTVPTKGLSLKLPMDPRICLNYLPGSFRAPVMAQTMIQPVDAVLLAAVKSRSDSYHSVMSTSPLLYLSHPASQPLKRPLTLVLPCPPNPEKKRQTRGRIIAACPHQPASPRQGVLVASVKTKETSDEFLIALGSRDKLWSVLDEATVRNQLNGLVSFEMTENFDRLLVVRLLSPLQPGQLTSLAEELEESVCRHAVTVVLQRRRDEPHAVLVAAVPSRDISWELSKLRAQGYGGPLETSPEISMHEGDRLVLRFSGNITCTGIQKDQLDAPHKRITFHSQQENHLLVHLKEVDPFGNYSSPHYKGTVTFHKVARGQPERHGDGREPAELLGEPVCKLPLTLPKKARAVGRPTVTRVKLCEATDFLSDSLLLWLSGQLSEEDVALLVPSLHLRRSAVQLVKLRAGGSPSTQAFHALAMWRRGLPAASYPPKASQLAHCLAKSGRPDLAAELLLREAASAGQGSLKQGGLNSGNQSVS